MNTWIEELIIVLVSSGVVGSLITAVSRKRERNSTENIRSIVQEASTIMVDDIAHLKTNQNAMTEILEDITTEIKGLKNSQDEIKKTSKKIQQDVSKFKKESEKVDFLFLKKLREKHILNGESDEIFEYLLDQKGTENGAKE